LAADRPVKLTAPSAFLLPNLARGGVDPAELDESRLETVHFDTPDLRLARWGCSLRHRAGEGWTLRLPSARGAPPPRLAFEGPASRPPPEAVSLVRAYVRRAALRPVARLSVWRRRLLVRDGGGADVAEIVDGEVSVLHGRRVADRFRELEVYASDGAAVGPLVGRLQEAGATLSDGTTTYQRALGPAALVPEVEPRPVPASPTAGDVIRAALTASVTALLRHDPGVRLGGDPEDVHQARVALRRLRSNLRTFRGLLDRDWAQGLRDEAGWLGRELGSVRDHEVLDERLEHEIGDLEPADRRTASALTQRIQSSIESARAELRQAIDSARYLDLVEALIDAAREPRLLPEAAAPAREVLPGLARQPWRRLRRAARALPADPPDEELHQLRILAKRARYAAEAVTPAAGPDAARFARRAARLQTVLGEHQDSVVARQWLRDAAGTGGRAFVAGLLFGVEQGHGQDARRRWPRAWQKLDRRRLRQWMR
jgi:CHAD domain-containing protein